MGRHAAVLALLAVVAGVAVPGPDAEQVRTVRLELQPGGSDRDLSGRVAVSEGRILRLYGWGLQPGDEIGPDWSWHCGDGAAPRSFILTLSAPADAQVRLSVASRTGAIPLAALHAGAPVEVPEVGCVAELLPTPQRLSAEGHADLPTLAAGPAGVTWCAWVASDGGEDTIRLSRYLAGRWEGSGRIPRVHGRIARVALAAAGSGRWVAVWGQERGGNWDLHSAVCSGGRWSRPARITRGPGRELNHQMASDAAGRVWLAWQALEGSESHVRLASWEQGKWSAPIQVSGVGASHWALAVGPEGRVYVAWDCAEAGSHNIFLRSLQAGQLSPVRRVTGGLGHESTASLACEPGGRLWIAYGRGEPGAAGAHRARQIELRCLEGEKLLEPPHPGAGSFAGESSQLVAGARGWVWLVHRQATPGDTWDLVARRFDGRAWSRPVLLPDSTGRGDSAAALAVSGDGPAWAAWATDSRDALVPSDGVYAAPLPLSPGVPD